MNLNEIKIGLAEILELDMVDETTLLNNEEEDLLWDSLAIITTIALVDSKLGLSLQGESLAECLTVGDVLHLIRES